MTALDRLHDIFPAIADDFRVEMHFAIAEGSRFSHQLADYLHRSRMRVLPWAEATPEHFDLAISPSSNGELHELKMPVLTLPHGAGHNKYRATEEGFAPEVSGLSRTQLMHEGCVVPAVVGLSHENQLALLRRYCPEALGRARVLGDPCFDRLRASVPMRERYRRELGTGQRTLIVVNSTWGLQALFGRQPDLAPNLATTLPADRYQVALVLHPNIWNLHSPAQLHLWTRRARAAGMLLIPPDRGWRATLVAADVVIADHGSLAIYSAALGKRLLLAEFGADEIVPGTPAAALGKLARRLSTVDARSGIDMAEPICQHEQFAAETFAWPGKSAHRLRRTIYEQLGIAEPSWDAHAEPVEPFTP